MSDKLQIIITGDAASVKRAFAEVTSGAERMGVSVTKANDQAAKSTANWTGAAQKAGAALGALSAISIRAAGQSEASQARVETAFTNAGLAVEDYGDSLERAGEKGLALAFDDEDVADSIASLLTVTQDYDRALQDLALAQDIARARQISLSQATNIVASVEAGRFRSLQQMGIVLAEGATATDYLTAAQDRFSGSAENFAATGAASWERFGNTVENALEGLGSHLSAAQGPMMALAAGGALLGGVKDVLDELGASAKIASLALGPVGLGLAIAGAALAFAFLTDRTAEWEDAADSAANATLSLNDRIYQLAAFGKQDIAGPLKAVNEEWSQVSLHAAETVKQINDIDKQIAELNNRKSNTQPPLSEAEQLDLSAQIEQLQAYRAELDKLALSNEQIDDITEDILALFSKPGIDAKKAGEDIAWYFDQFAQGKIDGEQLTAWINESAEDWTRYSTAVVLATDAQAAFNKQLEISSAAMNAQAGDLDNLLEPKRIAAALGQRAALLTLADSLKTVEENTVEAVLPTGYFTDALDVQVQKAEDAKAALAGYAEALGQVPAIADTNAANLASNASAAGSALGDAFRVAVGNTSDIGNSSQSVADWAKELINVAGEYGKIDDLLATGAISLSEYNAAQAAGNVIFDANARIQEDVLAIQAKQAPVIAALSEEQAKYWDELAGKSADQQAIALAYMDTETSAKALAAAQLAASAAAGELGTAGEATATKMITAAAEADPYLRSLLEDMGLISVGADGTITVNFGSVEDAGASLDDVVDAINTLNELIADAFNITINSNADSQRAELEGIVSLLNGLDNRSINYSVNASGNGISVGNPNGVGITPIAHGGIIPAANGYAGGSDILVGEFGPEILRRSGGGAFVLPTGASRGRSGSGGITLNLTLTGNNTFMGIDDFVGETIRQMTPALALAFEQYYAGHGVR